uniref:cytochrome b-245 heavy chain-like isoform X1 n=2 Tax=Styela clava TaxID=7725 RepID=UPI00193A789B|nr:cytochrome b-245 heavy chain-like isoform X1 [Styela clava]
MRKQMRGLLVNDVPKYFVILVWLLINGLLFGVTWQKYNREKTYFYTRVVLGNTLAISRSAAACMNFNCMLILLPVCRNLLSFVRGWAVCCPGRARRILDKNVTFHRLCAYMIVGLSLFHFYGHSYNVHRFSMSHNTKVDDASDETDTKQSTKLLVKLVSIGNGDGETYLDPIRQPTYPIKSVFLLTGGWTGLIMIASLFFMVTSSTEFIRRSYFEVFWYVHHLFIVFFGFLIFHSIGKQVRGQTNVDKHDPEYCSKIDPYTGWENDRKCSTPPVFEGGMPITWVWIMAPIFIYICERILRFVRYLQPVKILKVVKHPSKVLEIQMRKTDFHAEVGQYIFIQCPKLSRLEWHPFTLTSAPEEDYFSVHIRIVGDWTSGLSEVLGADEYAEIQPSWKIPRIAVDGPFGTASEDVFDYDVALCVGAGIGVTPFASLLKSVFYKTVNESGPMRLRKVYFFWVCPDTHAFEWFGDMLMHLENQLAESGCRDLIEYNIYLTRGWTAGQAKAIFVHEEDQRDVITGLEQKTNFGRPNWDDIFSRIADMHTEREVGVFFCGAASLSKILHKMCNKHSSASKRVSFHYNKENF